MAKFRTTVEIIDILGGPAKVARLSRRSIQQVSHWKARGTFPPQTYLVLTRALADRGHWAPPSLWQQVVPSVEEPAA